MASASRSSSGRLVRAALGALGLPLAAGCSGEEPPTGGVMLRVTTDMSIRNDLDTFVWSVTLNGTTESFASGGVPLTSDGDLPVTLAIAAGTNTTEPVTIRVDGRSGGAPTSPRVTREAKLTVPREGVKELRLPLEFLCTEASRREDCPEGSTCSAGECVPSAIEAANLPDYEPIPAPSCFDTAACFEQVVAEPRPEVDADGCVIKGTNAWLAPDANLAMVVKTSEVGAYGACNIGTHGDCLVPLAFGAPSGWETLTQNGESTGIRVPTGVCNSLGLGRSIEKLLVAQTSGRCPTLLPGTPICSTPAVCVPAEEACPREWDNTWRGLACSGAARPEHPMGRCYQPHRALAPDLKCCADPSVSTESPERDPLLIDDMSGGPALKYPAPAGRLPGTWWTSQENGAEAIEPSPYFFDYRPIQPAFVSEDGTRIERAACLSSEYGFSGYLAMLGFDWISTPGSVVPTDTVDVSRYTGLRFWAMAKPPLFGFEGFSKDIVVLFPNVDTVSNAQPSTCSRNPEEGECDDFRSPLTITDTWREYEVRWTDLTQQGFGAPFASFDKHLYQVIFGSYGPGDKGTSQPFDFCISQIYFTTDDERRSEGAEP